MIIICVGFIVYVKCTITMLHILKVYTYTGFVLLVAAAEIYIQWIEVVYGRYLSLQARYRLKYLEKKNKL